MDSKGNTDRRNFLTGGLLNQRDQMEPTNEPGISHSFDADTRQFSHLEQYTTSAMACRFELLFNMHQYPDAAKCALQVFHQLTVLEQQMSIFRTDSDICRINRSAVGGPVTVEPGLFDLLVLSRDIFEETRGAFDITSGALSEIWGFNRRQGTVPGEAEIETAVRCVGMDAVGLNNKSNQIQFMKKGLSLNLGAIGKGYALDCAAGLIGEHGIGDFLCHGGQSSVVARGECLNINPQDPDGAGWKVGISHPTHPERRVAEVRLVDSALGTSGTLRQGFFYRGRRYGHIIDPRSGCPTDHCLSSIVICDSAARADALATAFFVMTVEQVEEFCSFHSDVAAFLILTADGDRGIAIESFNTENLDWKRLL